MGEAGNQGPQAALVVGGRIGPYRVDESIGAGGKAAVFRCTDTRSGQVVAVKVLHPQTFEGDDEQAEVKRFTREFEALSRMDHPHIVRVYETGQLDGYPWIAMELIEGDDLEALIEHWEHEQGRARFEQVEHVFRALCDALQYVHELGLIHRDIKPSNVLLTRDRMPKLSDFGVVKDPSATGTSLTVAGRLVGTVAFMAPEQITGERVDARTDLYALGAVLYLMLTFKRPIEASSVAGYLARHLSEVPASPGELDPEVPHRLEQVCMRLLAKDPANRYPSARAVLQSLDRDEDTDAPPVRGRDDRLGDWSHRMARLEQEAPMPVALTGPPGSGRTFLLHAMADAARDQGVSVALSAGRRNTLVELLDQMGVDVAAVQPTKRLRAIAQQARKGPWVLAVDDLDKRSERVIDALSRLVKKLVAEEGSPLQLLFTARRAEGPLRALVAGTATGIPAETFELGPLGRRDVIAMMRDRGLTGPAAPVLGRRLHVDLGGMPGPIVTQLSTLVEAGWLERSDGKLRPQREVHAFARADLPVPAEVRSALEARLAEIDLDGTELVELLALLDRAASATLLEHCSERPEEAGRVLDGLVRRGLMERRREGEAEVVCFAHPSTAAVVRDRMSPERRRHLHSRIAVALRRRRRRSASLEVAHHLLEAGDVAEAYPLFIQGARRAARDNRYSEVFELCERAETVRDEAERDREPADAARLRRWLYMLRGEAHLARGNWTGAVDPLTEAVAAARQADDDAALTRCLGSLGRAHYRRGLFDRAAPILEEALTIADAGAPERAPATRALADILVRRGEFEKADTLWQEALEISMAVGSGDAEARARRGLAHVRAFQNRLGDAARLLDQADELLQGRGDPRVRAGVLARSIELDEAAGRLASALYRCDVLLELCQAREMSERYAEAYALTAEVHWASGDDQAALEAVNHSVTFARAHGRGNWPARLLAARILCNLERFDEATDALPAPEDVPRNALDDPAAQLAALKARIRARANPSAARDLANWCMTREPPLMVIRHARVADDIAHALTDAGDVPGARASAKRGLKAVQGVGCDELRLDLLLSLQRASADDRVLDAAAAVAARIARALPPSVARTFRTRPGVSEALARLDSRPDSDT